MGCSGRGWADIEGKRKKVFASFFKKKRLLPYLGRHSSIQPVK